MTITEKIMAYNSGRDFVVPGELVWVDVNSVMTMDYLGKQCFKAFESLSSTKKLFDKTIILASSLIFCEICNRFLDGFFWCSMSAIII